jgi:hypothetical protein
MFWRYIRTLRANPPGTEANDKNRHAMFNAAAEQFEQLFRAAADAGVMTRPILAYYGLNQASRAIAAIATNTKGGDIKPNNSNEDWKLTGHGITVPGLSSVARAGVLANVPVVNQGDSGAFTRLAEILNSGSLIKTNASGNPARRITMAELWGTLPETVGFSLATEPMFPVLAFSEERLFDPRTRSRTGEIEGIPNRVANDSNPTAALQDFLSNYPTVGQYAFTARSEGPWGKASYTNFNIVHLTWERQSEEPVTDLDFNEELSMRVASPYLREYYLFPALGENTKALHPLLAWWAILYTLSMLARYEPVTWGRMVDINRSVEAAAIEHVLDMSLKRLPRLVYDVIMDVAN